ncbi:hypothetical protein P5Y53_04870 [Dyella jiangningensis]|jgi:hypothetical protein|uniref:hypothetical protein n=1 Tax=Dyella jiangningensis TaxID=1379159 RepID=UPI00240FCBE2|nr:hypothetical protein [Dyella jiangningensis]MDG2536987.1 hypothetical protein [Dyella jiangningensis]
MISIIYLVAPHVVERERRAEAPELIDRDGVVFSLRGGPRQPKPTDRDWDSVAVYAPDELSEEEFQELYELNRPGVPELNLHY